MDFYPHDLSSVDPNLFAISWPAVIQVLVTIVILSFIVERALAPLFESAWFLHVTAAERESRWEDMKPLTAFLVGAGICIGWGFDGLSIILIQNKPTILGAAVTGAVIAGGSKASLKLFREVLNVQSSVSKRVKASHETKAAPVPGQSS